MKSIESILEGCTRYDPEHVMVPVPGHGPRIGRRVAGSDCLHLCSMDGSRVIIADQPTIDHDGHRVRLARVLVGLTRGDERLAVRECEDSRCVNVDHIFIGKATDVIRTKREFVNPR